MKKETQISLLVTALLSASVIFISYISMGRNDRQWGMYGLIALCLGAIEVIVGIGLMFFERKRNSAAGILIGALLTLVMGGSICSGLIKF